MLKNAAGGQGLIYDLLRETMTQYSEFNSVQDAKSRRDRRMTIGEIKYACLGAVGMTTRDTFLAALTPDLVSNGGMGRRVFLDANNPDDPLGVWPDLNEEAIIAGAAPPRETKLPKRLAAAVCRFLEVHHGGRPLWSVNRPVLDQLADVCVIGRDPTDPAHWRWKIRVDDPAVRREFFAIKKRMHANARKVDALVQPMYNRGAENVLRLAGVFALGDAVMDPASDLYRTRILIRHLNLAERFVVSGLKSVSADFAENAAEGDASKVRKRVINVIRKRTVLQPDGTPHRDCVKAGGRRWMRKRQVLQTARGGSARFSARDLWSEYGGLIEDGTIVEMEQEGNRPTLVRLRRTYD